MMLSAYERKGEAKLFDEQEQIRSFVRISKPVFSPSSGTSYSPGAEISSSPEVLMQPSLDPEIPRQPSARAVRTVGRFLLRRVGIRLIPIIGWGILAKDIYDFATD